MHSATKMSHSRLQSSTSCQLKTDVTFSPLTLQTQRLMWEFQVFQIILWDRSMWIITVNESDTDGWRNYECIEFCRHSFLSCYALGGIFLNGLGPPVPPSSSSCPQLSSNCQHVPNLPHNCWLVARFGVVSAEQLCGLLLSSKTCSCSFNFSPLRESVTVKITSYILQIYIYI